MFQEELLREEILREEMLREEMLREEMLKDEMLKQEFVDTLHSLFWGCLSFFSSSPEETSHSSSLDSADSASDESLSEAVSFFVLFTFFSCLSFEFPLEIERVLRLALSFDRTLDLLLHVLVLFVFNEVLLCFAKGDFDTARLEDGTCLDDLPLRLLEEDLVVWRSFDFFLVFPYGLSGSESFLSAKRAAFLFIVSGSFCRISMQIYI